MFLNAINTIFNVPFKSPAKTRVYSLTTLPTLTGNVSSVCLNGDCTRAYATINPGTLYYWSIDTSNVWTAATAATGTITGRAWADITCSLDGVNVIAIINSATDTSNTVFYSTDSGVTFNTSYNATAGSNAFALRMTSVAMSQTGAYAYMACYESSTSTSANRFFTSTDYGQTWTSKLSATIPGSTVKCDSTGQYVNLYAYIGTSGGSAPGISRDYGGTFVKPGGANAGQYGSKVYINSFGNTSWYIISFAGGAWTPITKIYYNGTTQTSINCNNTPSSVSAGTNNYRYIDCTNDGKIILVIEGFNNGTTIGYVWLCTNGIASAIPGQASGVFASEFTNFSTANSIPFATWRDVFCSFNDSFIFSNSTGGVYMYSWKEV